MYISKRYPREVGLLGRSGTRTRWADDAEGGGRKGHWNKEGYKQLTKTSQSIPHIERLDLFIEAVDGLNIYI